MDPFSVCVLYLLCWPVLKPQMTGEPTFPGEVTEKVSVRQSPIDPPTPVATAPAVTTVPLAGPAISKV